MNQRLLRRIGYNNEVDKVIHVQCPFCGTRVIEDHFRDKFSLKEFRVSGLCQQCQDEIFQDVPLKTRKE